MSASGESDFGSRASDFLRASSFGFRISPLASPPAGKDRMHDDQTVQRFIELRAQGWTYARLMTELNVSKPTLIAWSRKHQFQIQNLKAIELEALREKWLASTAERVNALGEQLRQVEARAGQTRCERSHHPSASHPGPQPAPPDRARHRPHAFHHPRVRNPRPTNTTTRSRTGQADSAGEGERPREPKLLGWLLAYRNPGQEKVKKW